MQGGRWRAWIVSAGILLVGASAVAAILVSRDWPFTQSAVTKDLQDELQGRVVIGKFRQTWFPPGCVADDLRVIRQNGEPPLLTARSLIVQSSWYGLPQRRISKIKVIGLHVAIPAGKGSIDSSILRNSGTPNTFSSIGEIEANEAVVELQAHKTGRPARTFAIHQLVLDHVGSGRTIQFRASMLVDKPAGELSAQGNAGPWNAADPSSTAFSGVYRFANADLKAFHGLRGILSSEGRFAGDFAKVEASGSVDVPQLHVDGSAQSVHLTGEYQAAVDAQTADTILRQVTAHVGRTTIVASGDVSGIEAQDSKTARLKMRVDTGRIEDLLNYFSEQKRPSMTGAVKLQASVELPPGPGFLKKVRLTGDFGVAGAKFTKATRQEPVNELSESASGIKVKHDERDVEDERTVVSNLRGHVVVQSGTAKLSSVSFEFPGAVAEMAGTFELISRNVDIHGTLRTTGSISDASTGFKAMMLKVATPFLKKKTTTVVPFAITGTASNPLVGLDIAHKLKL
jgi:hypothetical protein